LHLLVLDEAQDSQSNLGLRGEVNAIDKVPGDLKGVRADGWDGKTVSQRGGHGHSLGLTLFEGVRVGSAPVLQQFQGQTGSKG
jgi:hypothetical protein